RLVCIERVGGGEKCVRLLSDWGYSIILLLPSQIVRRLRPVDWAPVVPDGSDGVVTHLERWCGLLKHLQCLFVLIDALCRGGGISRHLPLLDVHDSNASRLVRLQSQCP